MLHVKIYKNDGLKFFYIIKFKFFFFFLFKKIYKSKKKKFIFEN